MKLYHSIDNNVTLKKIPARLLHIGLLATLVMGMLATSCNKKDDEPTTDETYISTASVAVTAFSLTADARVMKNLDSVFFSIDIDHGVIFNADSLPKGTNITKLIPKISYPTSVKSATIEMRYGSHRIGTVDYIKNSNDTIDFTGEVYLTLGTDNNAVTKTYTLKVNVHKADPDTIYWDKMATLSLPSRMAAPKSQKTVESNEKLTTLIEESDGTFTIAQTSDIFEGNWSRQPFNPGFTPRINTLTVGADNSLYLLDEEGNLHTSADGSAWTQCGSGWQEIIGNYKDILLGTTLKGTTPTMISYPESEYTSVALPAEFPLYGFSSAMEITSKWSPEPTIIVFGGYPFRADGKSPSWAFDGSQWVDIAENALPALSGLSVINYYSYLQSASSSLLKEFEVYLAFGGKDSSGGINNTIYVSYDHGINWQRAQDYMQMPEGVKAGYMVDALPVGYAMESNLSNRWKVVPSKRRLPFQIDGDLIKWDCPYIFLFGGEDNTGILNPQIRSGVLQRLTFEPLF